MIDMAIKYGIAMPPLLPLALPAYTHHVGNPETTKNGHLICWYTSGFV